jgi:uncharacterized OB-fold protein
MSSTIPVATVIEPGLFRTDPPVLLAGRCAACAALRFPRQTICPSCQGDQVEEFELSKSGTIYTFTVVRAAPPGYIGETPYALAVVELPEGLRVESTITADDLDALAIGDAVDFELITLGSADAPVISYAFRRRGDAG